MMLPLMTNLVLWRLSVFSVQHTTDITLVVKLDKLFSRPVLEIKAICHTRDLGKLARSWKQLRLLCPPDP